MALVSLVLLIPAYVILNLAYSAFFPERVTISVPGTEYSITHSRLLLKLLPAEHDREITFVVSGKTGSTIAMSPNTAGAYPINCYLITAPDGPYMVLVDPLYNHLLDLKREQLIEDGKWQVSPWHPPPDRSGSHVASDEEIMGRIMIRRRFYDYTEKTYLGRFESHPFGMRFVPASRSPEIDLHD